MVGHIVMVKNSKRGLFMGKKKQLVPMDILICDLEQLGGYIVTYEDDVLVLQSQLKMFTISAENNKLVVKVSDVI